MSETKPTKQSIFEGTMAQLGGGAIAATVVGIFESYGHFFPAKVESGFGTLIGIAAYIWFKTTRK